MKDLVDRLRMMTSEVDWSTVPEGIVSGEIENATCWASRGRLVENHGGSIYRCYSREVFFDTYYEERAMGWLVHDYEPERVH